MKTQPSSKLVGHPPKAVVAESLVLRALVGLHREREREREQERDGQTGARKEPDVPGGSSFPLHAKRSGNLAEITPLAAWKEEKAKSRLWRSGNLAAPTPPKLNFGFGFPKAAPFGGGPERTAPLFSEKPPPVACFTGHILRAAARPLDGDAC